MELEGLEALPSRYQGPDLGKGWGEWRQGTNAISCGCAAFGPAVAVEPLGSWILHQWKMKGPPILERFNKISSGQLLPESISLVVPISGKLGQQDYGCLKGLGGLPKLYQLHWERAY